MWAVSIRTVSCPVLSALSWKSLWLVLPQPHPQCLAGGRPVSHIPIPTLWVQAAAHMVLLTAVGISCVYKHEGNAYLIFPNGDHPFFKQEVGNFSKILSEQEDQSKMRQ